MNLEWRLSHFIPMEWEEAKNFQFGEYRLPTIKELHDASNNKIKGFESIYYWSSEQDSFFKDQAWFFDFRQGFRFRGDKRLNLYVRLCKEIKK